MDWLRQTLSVGRALGFNIELVGPDFIRQLHPFYNLDGVIGALHTPDDGHVDPSGPAHAMAIGARQLGRRSSAVAGPPTSGNCRPASGRSSTEQGDIVCEHVVNAGGTYARQMGEWSGLQLPMTSMTHHYLVTDTVPEFMELEKELPVIRDDKLVSGYIRMEQKSGLIGIYEKAKTPTPSGKITARGKPKTSCSRPTMTASCRGWKTPWSACRSLPNLGIKREVHGAISHPPDGNPLIGPAPGVKNYWCCCGTQIGIGWGPGLTRELARWMVHGAADISMREFDPRRFGEYAKPDWQVIKAKEDYCLRHEIPFPHFNRLARPPGQASRRCTSASRPRARCTRKCTAMNGHGGLRKQWWTPVFRPAAPDHYYSFARPAWFDMVAIETKAVREAAGIMDISAFSKIEVAGPDAHAFLDRLTPNRLPQKPGGICLTHLLNRRGRIEAEVTIVRLAQDRFYLVCAAFFEQRLIDHLTFAKAGDENADIINRSNAWAALTINGPKSRDILSACTDAALDNASFRWMSAQEITVAGHRMWAFRMSYAGELGWELHGPREHLLAVYDALWAAGEKHGLTDYGSFTMNALRMEKGFKGAGELTNEVTLPEADVMRFVKLDKDFFGKAQTQESLAQPLPWVCAYLEIEPDGIWDGNGGEAVRLDGKVVGSTASVAYCHTRRRKSSPLPISSPRGQGRNGA
jgi:dimethylglycine dehydrogenase